MECKKATLEGTPSVGNNPTLETTSVTYSECKAFGVEAKIKFEGCQYKFNEPKDLEEEAKDKTHSGSVTIVCPKPKEGEKQKTIVISTAICQVTVPAQTVSLIDSTNSGKNLITEPKVAGIEYTEIGSKCPNIIKSPETFKNGTLQGNSEAEEVTIN